MESNVKGTQEADSSWQARTHRMSATNHTERMSKQRRLKMLLSITRDLGNKKITNTDQVRNLEYMLVVKSSTCDRVLRKPVKTARAQKLRMWQKCKR